FFGVLILRESRVCVRGSPLADRFLVYREVHVTLFGVVQDVAKAIGVLLLRATRVCVNVRPYAAHLARDRLGPPSEVVRAVPTTSFIVRRQRSVGFFGFSA